MDAADTSNCRAALWQSVAAALDERKGGVAALGAPERRMLERLAGGARWSDALSPSRLHRLRTLYRARCADPGFRECCMPRAEGGGGGGGSGGGGDSGAADNPSLIANDVGRTFAAFGASEAANAAAAADGNKTLLEPLRRVLVVCSDVVLAGYCQGMNLLAAALLLHSPGAKREGYTASEGTSFALLYALCCDAHLVPLFERKTAALSELTRALDSLLRNRLPTLHAKLAELEFDAPLFCCKWLGSLFAVGPAPCVPPRAEGFALSAQLSSGAGAGGEEGGGGAEEPGHGVMFALLDLIFGSSALEQRRPAGPAGLEAAAAAASGEGGVREGGAEGAGAGTAAAGSSAAAGAAEVDDASGGMVLNADWMLRIGVALLVLMAPRLLALRSQDEVVEQFDEICREETRGAVGLRRVLVEAMALGLHPRPLPFLAELDRAFLEDAYRQHATAARQQRKPQGAEAAEALATVVAGQQHQPKLCSPFFYVLFRRAHSWTLCPSLLRSVYDGHATAVGQWWAALTQTQTQAVATAATAPEGSAGGAEQQQQQQQQQQRWSEEERRILLQELLLHACAARRGDLVRWALLGASPRADPTAPNLLGFGALHVASMIDSPKLARLLLRTGAPARVSMVGGARRLTPDVAGVSAAELCELPPRGAPAARLVLNGSVCVECGKLVKERGAGSALPPLMFCSIACRDSAARPFPVPPPLLPPAGAAAPAAAAARPPCPGPGSERIGFWDRRWVPDDVAWCCTKCSAVFGVFLWRSRCEYCGVPFCGPCLKEHHALQSRGTLLRGWGGEERPGPSHQGSQSS
jgi:hypothetical protein